MALLARFAMCCVVGVALTTGCSKDKSDNKRDNTETPKKQPPPVDAAPKPTTDAPPATRENTDFDVPAVIE